MKAALAALVLLAAPAAALAQARTPAPAKPPVAGPPAPEKPQGLQVDAVVPLKGPGGPFGAPVIDEPTRRLYLPRDWLREAGGDPDAWLLHPVPDARIETVVLRLLAEADRLYARAAAGVGSLPLDCRPGINAARLLYAGIGHEVRRVGGDGVRQRARVPGWRKALLLARAALGLWPSQAAL